MNRRITATYRLQLNEQFTLRDARARVPYLRALGISHLYLSPILTARKGSTHGYDVTDPTHVSVSLGGDAAFVELAEYAHGHEMGIVLDIVPNHMGIGADNPYWDDTLTHGQQSRYADWFDVMWRASAARLAGKVLVPVLGDTLANVIARNELTVEKTPRGQRLRYFDHDFPLRAERVASDISTTLERQHYQLAHWREAERDLNYRRFFDVNDLICLRVERADVFDATHATVLRFVADGLVDGLRVDHIDGLLEPRRYLERLRSAVDLRRPSAQGEHRFPIFVEKILAGDEELPREWPVDGTTGYEFLSALDDLFIHPDGFATLETNYVRSRGAGCFRNAALDAKRKALRSMFNADVRRIAPMLAEVAKHASWPRRTIGDYARAIIELTAQLPVYRTYMDAEQPRAGARDRALLTQVIERVRRDNRVDAIALDSLARALLDDSLIESEPVSSARLRFVLRWQQLTGPAAAKGVEDTAFYSYAPLTSRNEVGANPELPLNDARARFHSVLAQRANYPQSLNATNTHDTKRSADVRSRLHVLSERADEWQATLAKWNRLNRRFQTRVMGRRVPDAMTQDFIYQALLGIWPPLSSRAKSSDLHAPLFDVRSRLAQYMQKSVREAKTSTSWTDPDAAYERAIADFVRSILDESNAQFLADVDDMARALAVQGDVNMLARVVLHLIAPGVPDLYRGDELPFFALVDPDNRRPVNYATADAKVRALRFARGDKTSGIANEPVAQTIAGWRANHDIAQIKFWVTHRLLSFRSTVADLGDTQLLDAEGALASHALAIQRDSSGCLAVVPRLTGALGNSWDSACRWGDTRIRLPRGSATSWRSVLTDAQLANQDDCLRLSDLFADLPVAVVIPA